MKTIYILIFLSVALNASTYLAQIEPYENIKIKSEVSGTITFVDRLKEFSLIKKNTLLLTIDSKEESLSLRNMQDSLNIQNRILEIHKENYKKKSKVKHISDYEKSQEHLFVLNSKQTIANLRKSIKSLEYRKSKKIFNINNIYLNEIFIHKNEFVEQGDLLYELYDFSKSKLQVFIKASDINQIRNKKVFVNNIQDDFKIEKVSKVRDTRKISTYKVILIKENLKTNNFSFGQVVSVEFK